ncbi:hypothetical protein CAUPRSCDRAFT_2775, partial [Caulochytrium protostelioides]
YHYKVAMTCGGCSGSVTRILQKAEGVSDFDVSLENKTVSVTTSCLTKEQVFDILKKSGKNV